MTGAIAWMLQRRQFSHDKEIELSRKSDTAQAEKKREQKELEKLRLSNHQQAALDWCRLEAPDSLFTAVQASSTVTLKAEGTAPKKTKRFDPNTMFLGDFEEMENKGHIEIVNRDGGSLIRFRVKQRVE
jgi:hypothetical protein